MILGWFLGRSCRHTSGEREILAKLGVLMSKIDEIEAAVAGQRTVIEGAVTLLTGLHAALTEALEDEDDDRLQSIVDDLDAGRNQLAQAITANTPVAGSPGEGQLPPAGDANPVADPAPTDEPDAPEGDAAG